MAIVRPIRTPRPEPEALSSHALDNLRYIRDTMERAGSFTAVPGLGGIWMGLTAVGAAFLAASRSDRRAWLAVWMAEGALALLIGVVGASRKAHAAKMPLLSGPGRKFLWGLIPPLAAGAFLTVALYHAGMPGLIPGAWLLLYGTGVLSGGAASVRIIPVMGLCFMVMGAITLLAPAAWANTLLAAGFGGIHIVFGTIITVKYGG